MSLIVTPDGEYQLDYEQTRTRPSKFTISDKVSLNFIFDDFYRAKTIKGFVDGNPVLDLSYDYYKNNNIKSIKEGTITTNYFYNALSELIKTSSPNGNVKYIYDFYGNRKQLKDNNSTLTGLYENNRLIGYDGAIYEYDQLGNINKITDKNGQLEELIYNANSELIKIIRNGVVIAEYAYDHAGRRVMKKVSGIKTYFLYDGYKLIGEYDSAGNAKKVYLYLPTASVLPFAVYEPATQEYYYTFYDGTRRPRVLVDKAGDVVWKANYDPFGKAKVIVEKFENNFRLLGQYYDKESGYHYNMRRYYDPKTGRYLQSDPIGIQGGMNVYRYAENNPLNKSDIMGEESNTEYDCNFGYSIKLLGALFKKDTLSTLLYFHYLCGDGSTFNIPESFCGIYISDKVISEKAELEKKKFKGAVESFAGSHAGSWKIYTSAIKFSNYHEKIFAFGAGYDEIETFGEITASSDCCAEGNAQLSFRRVDDFKDPYDNWQNDGGLAGTWVPWFLLDECRTKLGEDPIYGWSDCANPDGIPFTFLIQCNNKDSVSHFYCKEGCKDECE